MVQLANDSFLKRLPEEDKLAIQQGQAQQAQASTPQSTPSQALQEIQSNPKPSRADAAHFGPEDQEAVYQAQLKSYHETQATLAQGALEELEPEYDDYTALPPIVARAEYDDALAQFNADPAVAQLRQIAAFDPATLSEAAEEDAPPATPLDSAVAEVEAAQQTIDELQAAAAEGNAFARIELKLGGHQATLAQAQAELNDVIAEEISAEQYGLRHLPINNRTSFEIAAGYVVGQYQGSAEGEQILRAAVEQITTDYVARQDRLDNLQGTADDIINADGDAARLEAYTDALGEGDQLYQDALTAIILREDRGALGSWLNPEFINEQAENGALGNTEYTLAAQAFVRAANADRLPTTEIGSAVEFYSQDGGELHGSVLDGFLIGFRSKGPSGGTVDTFTPIQRFAELNQLLDAAGSNSDTQQFRQEFADYLNDTYVQNPNILNSEVRNVAAAGAALIISGDASQPELAQDFLTGLHSDDPAKFDEFMDRATLGSYYFSEAGLEGAQRLGHALQFDAADFAQPDAIAQLVSAFGEAGSDAGDPTVGAVALELAQAPHDNANWTTSPTDSVTQDRRNAWATLFSNHSTHILETLTDPDGLPTVQGIEVEAAFIGRSEDLGALLRYVQVADNNGDVAVALGEYNSLVRDRIANAEVAETTIAESRRLGFLAASITESVDQGFEEFKSNQAQNDALLGFVLDLTFSALPVGSLAKGVVNEQIESFIKNQIGEGLTRDFLLDSLKGFSGQLIGSGEGKLTEAARQYIFDQIDNDDVAELVADLTESNAFIRETLFADLPAPGYTPPGDLESGRADVIDIVTSTYDIALEALTD